MPRAELLLAGFPCQEFSACGPRKGLDSERGSLYLAMIRYAIVHRPKVILGENVSGILRLNRGADLKKIQEDFKAVGYRCLTWEMHANHFGVAQARHRVFLVFIRDDLPGDPTPPPKRRKGANTVRSAIGDLVDADESDLPNQGQYFRAARAGRGHGQGDEISPADAPGYTVRANSRSRVQFHYSLPRRLTVRECARLQSFPDDFLFPHDATSNMFQIGNAVPPVLAHCVAKRILSYLRHPSVRSAE